MKLRRSSIFAAAIAIAAGLVVAVPSAGAAPFPYPIYACKAGVPASKSPGEQWVNTSQGGLPSANNCVDGGGLSLGNGNASAYPDQEGWGWQEDRAADTASVTFTVSGGDSSTGMHYQYADGIGTGTIVAFTRALGAPPDTITVPMTGKAAIAIDAWCTLPSCPAAPPLVINDVTATISDSSPPFFGGQVQGHDLGLGDLNTIWTNGVAVHANVTVTDTGVGLMQTSAILAGGLGGQEQELWSELPTCQDLQVATLATSDFCDMDGALDQRLDLTANPDGLYQLKFRAIDALGNVGTSPTVPIGLDRTRPVAPTGVHWIGDVNTHGWTGTPAIKFGWDAAPDQGELGSPIDHEYWSLRKIDGAAATDAALDTSETPQLFLSSEGRWRGAVEYVDKAGNAGERSYVDVGYDLDDPPAPTLATVHWISGDKLITGYDQTWATPTIPAKLESGLCGYAVQVDSASSGVPPIREDLAPTATSYRIPPDTTEGLRYIHVRSVSCAGRASKTSTKALQIDKTPPTTTLTGLPAQPWLTSATTVTINAVDPAGPGGQSIAPASGVISVRYRLDSGPPETVAGTTGVVQIPQGVHTLTYSATDLAGNASAVATRVISIDSSGPQIAMDTEDLSDRLTIGGTITDNLSGIKSARVEYRRTDTGADPSEWTTLGEAQVPDPVGLASMRIVRTIDDDKFAAGIYEFRITATDMAGNTHALGDVSGESTRFLKLPARSAATISAAIADVSRSCRTSEGKACASMKKCPRKTSCRMVDVVRRDTAAASVVRPYAAHISLVGEALSELGTPLAGVAISVQPTEEFGQPGAASTVTTDTAGRFELPIAAGPSRTFSVRFSGDGRYLPASATARVTVRTGAELTLSKSKLHGGETLRFSGHLLGAVGHVPTAGKRVEIQFLTPAGWFPTIGSPLTDKNGRFSTTYKWPKVAQRTTYLFRVHVFDEQPWPYAEGSSKPERVTVLP